MTSFNIPLRPGVASAMLTVGEFLLGSIAAALIPFLTTKIIFLRLVKRKKYQRRQVYTRVKIFLEVIALAIGILMTTGVFLIELNMKQVQVPSENTIETRNWIMLDYNASRSNYKTRQYVQYSSTHDIEINELSIDAAKEIECRNGIKRLPYGELSGANRTNGFIYPQCRSESIDNSKTIKYKQRIRYGNWSYIIESYNNLTSNYTFRPYSYYYYYLHPAIFPNKNNNFNFSKPGFDINKNTCDKQKIIIFNPFINFTLFYNSSQHLVVDTVNQFICEKERNRLISPMKEPLLKPCVELRYKTNITGSPAWIMEINTKCMTKKKSKLKNYRGEIELTDVSFAFYNIGRRFCFDTSILLKYFIVPINSLQKRNVESDVKVIIPYQIQELTGNCEEADSQIAYYAWAYPSIVKWYPKELHDVNDLSSQKIFHAYLMHIARYHVYNSSFGYFPSDSRRHDPSIFHISTINTKVLVNFGLYLTILCSLVCFSIILVHILSLCHHPKSK